MEKIAANAKLAEVIVAVNLMVDAFNTANDRRGPKSSREMTDQDARRILPTGDLAKASHKDAAATLGLSYAQVYSCRGQYTFKHIHKEVTEKLAKPVEETSTPE